ncbi:signal peptidase I [Candidatus Sumerlaeota bacterium]|nr:signal peptidase I [Candidatus Sumerlaeota bacterium]
MTAKHTKHQKSSGSAKASGPQKSSAAKDAPAYPGGPAREWIDTLVFAFLLAMFIRTFVVELYKIPSGSMSPTLIGDEVAEVDMNNDGELDLVVLRGNGFPQVFLRKDGEFSGYGEAPPSAVQKSRMQSHGFRFDRIVVNKLAYLFGAPQRGDIAVFKTPKYQYGSNKREFDEDRPIFVKRVCGLPGETVTFGEYESPLVGGRLTINGEIVNEPPVYQHRRYIAGNYRDSVYHDYNDAANHLAGRDPYKVPAGNYLMLGDNTWNSSDGRCWGPVPEMNFKGRAFLRYWPLMAPGKGLNFGWIGNFGLLEQSNPLARWIAFFLFLAAIYWLAGQYDKFDQRWKRRLEGDDASAAKEAGC